MRHVIPTAIVAVVTAGCGGSQARTRAPVEPRQSSSQATEAPAPVESQRPSSQTADELYRWCKTGQADWCTRLGEGYATGQYGGKFIPQSYNWAFYFFREGCRGGHVDGCHQAGNLLESGVIGDMRDALPWYEESCRRGHQLACTKRVQLGAKLSSRGSLPATECEKAWAHAMRLAFYSMPWDEFVKSMDLAEFCRAAPLRPDQAACILEARALEDIDRCPGHGLTVVSQGWYCFDIFRESGSFIKGYNCHDSLLACIGGQAGIQWSIERDLGARSKGLAVGTCRLTTSPAYCADVFSAVTRKPMTLCTGGQTSCEVGIKDAMRAGRILQADVCREVASPKALKSRPR